METTGAAAPSDADAPRQGLSTKGAVILGIILLLLIVGAMSGDSGSEPTTNPGRSVSSSCRQMAADQYTRGMVKSTSEAAELAEVCTALENADKQRERDAKRAIDGR